MKRKILITGGAGFIGTNTAMFYLDKGDYVSIFDNFSRKGSKSNVQYIQSKYRKNLTIINGDITNSKTVINKLVKDIDIIFHLAGQVAVTTSVINPRRDFEINAMGTLNMLEAVRKYGNNPIFVYSSTNKVYGSLDYLKVSEEKTRYILKNNPHGISEDFKLEFYSPYGCSKGAGDQYVHDYHRIYGLRTIVFRQSCIYGPHQFGIEDQGWLAWFFIRMMQKKKITIFGNGKQVRDILYVDDLIKAYDLAISKIEVTKGEIYNIGGGLKNTISIWLELKGVLEKLFEQSISAEFQALRPGDQKIYVSDIRKSKRTLDGSQR